ncbi:MAG: hypothetical protein RMX63_03575 [Aulosira sp. ZfuCHP01]|nr:hypothetical protein [Aulosira sp. DedVER01a]MDZ8050522.1 hypothetical protein [Aulosira sp. ZfuCHP01]
MPISNITACVVTNRVPAVSKSSARWTARRCKLSCGAAKAIANVVSRKTSDLMLNF